jgi:hypothetical protein
MHPFRGWQRTVVGPRLSSGTTQHDHHGSHALSVTRMTHRPLPPRLRFPCTSGFLTRHPRGRDQPIAR